MKKIGIVFLLCFCLLLTAVPAMASYPNQTALSAEYLLSNLAREKKTERIIGGITLSAVGVGTGLLFSTIKSDQEITEDEAKYLRNIGYIMAGFITGAGIITLALPSAAENHYSDVMQIDDPLKKEEAAYSKLVFCADQAKTNRLISGATSAAMALYFFSAKSDYYNNDLNTYNALGCAAIAGASICIKSVEEKMLDRYHEGRKVYANEFLSPSRLNFSWLPNGQITAVYSYRF